MQNYGQRRVLLEFPLMLFISDLEVNIKLLLMTFVDDIMVTEIAKKETPKWPDVANTVWLGQTSVFYCTKMLLINSEQKPRQAWHYQL